MSEEEKTEREVTVLDLPKEAQGLAGALLAQSALQNADSFRGLMEGYRADLEMARAELAVIRTEVSALFGGRWLPNPDAVLKALYPNRAQIEEYLEGDADK